MSRLRRAAAAAIIALLCCSCLPNEMSVWRQVVGQRVQTCEGAVDVYWPASSRAWALRIMYRESRGIATAQNSRSSAAGCFQLLAMHADLFVDEGCSWAQRYNARCNVLAALRLYRSAGTRPWSL